MITNVVDYGRPPHITCSSAVSQGGYGSPQKCPSWSHERSVERAPLVTICLRLREHNIVAAYGYYEYERACHAAAMPEPEPLMPAAAVGAITY
jgi:hypothetical protein